MRLKVRLILMIVARKTPRKNDFELVSIWNVTLVSLQHCARGQTERTCATHTCLTHHPRADPILPAKPLNRKPTEMLYRPSGKFRYTGLHRRQGQTFRSCGAVYLG